MSHGKFRASFEVSIKFKPVFFLNPYRRCSHRHSCLYHCISGNNWASQDCTPDSRWVSEGRGKESNRVLGLMTDHESLGLWSVDNLRNHLLFRLCKLHSASLGPSFFTCNLGRSDLEVSSSGRQRTRRENAKYLLCAVWLSLGQECNLFPQIPQYYST